MTSGSSLDQKWPLEQFMASDYDPGKKKKTLKDLRVHISLAAVHLSFVFHVISSERLRFITLCSFINCAIKGL